MVCVLAARRFEEPVGCQTGAVHARVANGCGLFGTERRLTDISADTFSCLHLWILVSYRTGAVVDRRSPQEDFCT